MSVLTSRLDIDHVVCKAGATSRKRVLQTIAETVVAADTNAIAADPFDGPLERERLGSTGIGEGVAIPHCRHAISDIQVCLLTTEDRVDYDAVDGETVDIFFALIVPKDENQAHLRALADLSTVLVEPENRKRLRRCVDSETLLTEMKALLAGVDA